jgi:hypothetical protein
MTEKQQGAWQARRDELERRDRQQREAVIAEFAAGDPDATMQAMAAEILRYRARLAEARRGPAAEVGPTAPADRPTGSR